jgi:type I restriction enzyme S subunit
MGKMIKVRLNELGEIITGNTPSKKNKEYYDSNDIPFVKPDDLIDYKITSLKSSKEFISNAAESKARILKKGSVLFTCIGIIGKVGIIDCDKAAFNQQINAIVPNDKINNRYLAYCLMYNKNWIKEIANAPVVPIISKSQFEGIEILIDPNLETQHKIVQVLDKAQALIDKRKEQIKLCDELIQSLFYDMFGTMDIFKTKWEIKKLKDIANYHIGLTYKPSEICDDGIIVLRASNIQNGRIVLDDIVRVNKNIKSELLVKKGDILMCSRSGSASLVGKAALIPDLNEKMSFGAFMTIIRSDYNVYLLNYIRSSAFRSQIRSGATTTINQITLKMLDNIEVPLPPLELQNLFAEKVQKIEHQKQLLQQSLSLLEDNFNSLMQKAFKGELFQ